MNSKKKSGSLFNLFESTEYKTFTNIVSTLELKEKNKQNQVDQYLLNLRIYSNQREKFNLLSRQEHFVNRTLMLFDVEKELKKVSSSQNISSKILKATHTKSKDSHPSSIKMKTFKRY